MTFRYASFIFCLLAWVKSEINLSSNDFSVLKPCSQVALLNLTTSGEDEAYFHEEKEYILNRFSIYNVSYTHKALAIHPKKRDCVHYASQLHIRKMDNDAIYSIVTGRCESYISNPEGMLWNPLLENYLQTVSEVHLKSRKNPHPLKRLKNHNNVLFPRILHVGTEFYSTGGHTRVLLSFADFLSNRIHGLFVTKDGDIPDMMFKVINKNHTVQCDEYNINCARRLRLLAMKYDLIILHVHMNDVIPVIAFGQGYNGPPVILFDHADHLPWVGTSILHARLVFRKAAFRLSAARGLDVSRTLLMPLPASPFHSITLHKSVCRKALGFKSNQVVMLAMSNIYKFHPNSTLFLEPIMEILKSNSNAYLAGVGAPPNWKKYLEQNHINKNQYIITDFLEGVWAAMYHVAADIHLDSFPFSSITSMLESILDGGVAISFCPWTSLSKLILCVETADYGNIIDRTIPNPVLSCRTWDAYKNALNALVQSPKLLRSLQNLTAHSMRRHTGQSWATAMEEVFVKIKRLPRIKPWEIRPLNTDLFIGKDGLILPMLKQVKKGENI
eukprot:gene5423-10865_t